MVMENFEGIYFNISKQPGRCRFAESGFAWKPAGSGETFTFDKDTIGQAQWSRAARGYELKVLSRTAGVNQFDGFQQEDFDRLSRAFKLWYSVNLEQKEHALRGWNWGKGEFGKAELSFSVQNRPAFEIPYTEIANTNLAGRNEVAVEFSLPTDGEEIGTNGHLGGARAKGRRTGGARDQLVEARFYIPGTVAKRERTQEGEDVKEEQDEEEIVGEEVEEQNAANTWYETLVDKADIGDVAGDTIASFQDILHLTPRARFDVDMYEKSFRLRGKTYDYKIQYDSIKKFFLLPKPDDVHTLITLGLEPPLRQGQTRYPFIVMQVKREEDIELDLNLSEEDIKDKYKGKLLEHYSGPLYSILSQLFKGIAGKKITSPSSDFSSRHQQAGIKCSIKANEGLLYCLDKAFLFVPKPATYISIEQVQLVTMSRVGGAVSASRTFDITFSMKPSAGALEHNFTNINREEQQPLEDFFKAKNIKVRNEMQEESAILAAALKDQDLESSDEEVAQAARGSADEDSESEDEDFLEESESDVAEEFDSAHESSSVSGSDVEMADGDEDTEKAVERPKKKPKRQE